MPAHPLYVSQQGVLHTLAHRVHCIAILCVPQPSHGASFFDSCCLKSFTYYISNVQKSWRRVRRAAVIDEIAFSKFTS